MAKTYWFTHKDHNGGIVWAGRKEEQRYIRDGKVDISVFSDYRRLHRWYGKPSCYIRHPTYKAACAHAGINPVRIKWG